MFNLVKLLHLRPGLAPAQRARVESILHEAGRGHVESRLQPTLPGVFNGGDLVWRVRFESEAAYRAISAQMSWRSGPAALLGDVKIVAHVDSATFEDGSGGGNWSRTGVYRVLLLSVNRPAAAGTVERFEAEMMAMPRYIDSIRAWRLSRVREAAGSRRWSHVWEQEYADAQGLAGAYMRHPYHWGVVDRWFDPESTDWIVDPCLCHSFCNIN